MPGLPPFTGGREVLPLGFDVAGFVDVRDRSGAPVLPEGLTGRPEPTEPEPVGLLLFEPEELLDRESPPDEDEDEDEDLSLELELELDPFEPLDRDFPESLLFLPPRNATPGSSGASAAAAEPLNATAASVITPRRRAVGIRPP